MLQVILALALGQIPQGRPPRIGSPEIDWASPQSAGLAYCVPLFAGVQPLGTELIGRFNARASAVNSAPVVVSTQRGPAVIFDGTDDRIDYPFQLNVADLPMTISAWIWLDSLRASPSSYIWNHSSAGGNLNDIFFVDNDEIAMLSEGTGADQRRDSVAGVLTANRWYHVVGTNDGTTAATGMHLYVDGVEVASYSTSINGTADSGSNALINIGGRGVDNARNINAQILDVCLWTREMTPGEVRALYDSDRSGRWERYQQQPRVAWKAPAPPPPGGIAPLMLHHRRMRQQ